MMQRIAFFLGLTIAVLSFVLCHGISAAQPPYPSGDEILDQIDRNLSSQNRIFTSKMVIHGRRGSRTVVSKSWLKGEEKAFTEYLSPPREEGVKMLKLEDNLWMYSPDTDRTIRISGHMLRQSVMGSDLSYEDMMEDSRLRSHYDASVTGEETLDGRSCWIVSLVATTEDVAYHSRKLWVDKERIIPLKMDLFAKSGKLLKTMELKDVQKLEGRWFPMRMIFKDVLKSGEGTEFITEEILFDQDIPEHIFSKASLKR